MNHSLRVEQFGRAADALGAALSGNEDWSKALQFVADVSGARAAIIFSTTSNELPPSSPAAHWAIESYDRRDDLRYVGLKRLLRTGLGVDQDIFTPDEIRNNPFYTQYLARFNFKWYAGIPITDGKQDFILTLQRSDAQGYFDHEEQQHLRRLGCLISQSITSTARLANVASAGALKGLEADVSPALLISGSGNIIEVNSAVDEGTRRRLRLHPGQQLLGRTAYSSAVLNRIRAVLDVQLPADHPARLPLAVLQVGGSPLLLRFRLLRRGTARLLDLGAVLVLINNLRPEGRLVATTVLMDAFGLTPQQATVAALIGAGLGNLECAERLGISVETVKSVLQKVFQKTQVSSRLELGLLLSRIGA